MTLASLFAIRGLTVAGTREATGQTQISGIGEAVSGDLLVSVFDGRVFGVSVSILWWVCLTLLSAWFLNRTRFGNWIYATGGDLESATRAGVPVRRVKLILFTGTAAAAALVGVLAMFQVDSADVTRGNLKEFQTATATVIGGTLLSGGYGSPIGTFFGALLFGMVSQGFFFTNVSDDWFQAFLGIALLVAVLVNTYTRKYALSRQAGEP